MRDTRSGSAARLKPLTKKQLERLSPSMRRALAADSRGHGGAAQILRRNTTPPRANSGGGRFLGTLGRAASAVDQGFAVPGLGDDSSSVAKIRARNKAIEKVLAHPLRDPAATAALASLMLPGGRRIFRNAERELPRKLSVRERAHLGDLHDTRRGKLLRGGETAARAAAFMAGGNAAVLGGVWGTEKLFGPGMDGPLFGPGLRFWELPKEDQRAKEQRAKERPNKQREHDGFASDIAALTRSGRMKPREAAKALNWADDAKPWEALREGRDYLHATYKPPKGGWAP